MATARVMFNTRMPPEIYDFAKEESVRKGISLNSELCDLLSLGMKVSKKMSSTKKSAQERAS